MLTVRGYRGSGDIRFRFSSRWFVLFGEISSRLFIGIAGHPTSLRSSFWRLGFLDRSSSLS
ncbi:hypothetical protein HOY80DRAFT_1034587 [Tuber brumale]|nr:hypothetical protein HOY80DRAFT_1034587 [Tuber brumale]